MENFDVTEAELVAMHREIYYSSDAGKSWEIIIRLPDNKNDHFTFSNMYFKNPNTGYAIGSFGLLKFVK